MAIGKTKSTLVLLKIESYEGQDTFLRCGNDLQDYLYAIVAVDAEGTAEIVDSSYRTVDEALRAWPELSRPEGNRKTR